MKIKELDHYLIKYDRLLKKLLASLDWSDFSGLDHDLTRLDNTRTIPFLTFWDILGTVRIAEKNPRITRITRKLKR